MWLDDNTVIACSRCDAVFWTHIMSPVLISILCILFVKLGGGRCFLYVCICVFIFSKFHLLLRSIMLNRRKWYMVCTYIAIFYLFIFFFKP